MAIAEEVRRMNRRDDGQTADLTRRQFVATTAAGTALLVARCAGGRSAPPVAPAAAAAPEDTGSGPFQLPPLPWAEDALEPHISARTIGLHHGKHHAGYVRKLNDAVAATEYEGASLADVVRRTAGREDAKGVFNNAAQSMNHEIYWNSMRADGGGDPPAELADRLESSFGSVSAFRERFAAAAAGQFGSGWAWLALDGEDLVVLGTSNADTPVAHAMKPLLTIDVWEHAYYLDWQNRRRAYIDAWLADLVNWDHAVQALSTP
jgi:Fe-Mn family superoxide dismutase